MVAVLSGAALSPSKVTAIADGAFAECKSLASITIPESVTVVCLYRVQVFGKHHYPGVSDGRVPLQGASLWQASLSWSQ